MAKVSNRLVGQPGAFFAVVLLGLNPAFIEFGRMGRYYMTIGYCIII